MEIYLVIIIAMLATGAGAALMWMVNNNLSKSKAAQIIKEAEEKAEVIKKDKLLEAKEKFLQLKTEHEKEVNQRNAQILKEENKIKQQEQSLKSKMENTQRKDSELDSLKLTLEKHELLIRQIAQVLQL